MSRAARVNKLFPYSIHEMDNAWLSGAMRAPVTHFTHRFIEGGVLSDAYIVSDIRYANGSSGPASAVAKFANAVDDRRAFAVTNNSYAKELNFYRDLKHQVPLRTPEIYALASDNDERPEFFVILMEDLTAHSRVFDQVVDPPTEPFMRKIALELATMHAKFWESGAIQADWLGSARYRFPLDASCRDAVNQKEQFFGLWQTMFGGDLRDTPGCEQTRAISDILAGPRCEQIIERIYDTLSSRPRTLLHGDMRADNIFRTNTADGQLTYVDWQLTGAGPPGPEFTQAWQHSANPELRRKDRDVLRQYHDRRVALNPDSATYTYDMLFDDYRFGYLLWWTALMSLGVATLPGFDKPEGARMKRLWGQGLTWMNIAMTDHDCLGLVESIVEDLPR